MPIYEIEAPDGRMIEMEGDTPPNEQAIQEAFNQLGVTGQLEGPPQSERYQNILAGSQERMAEGQKQESPILNALFPRGMEAAKFSEGSVGKDFLSGQTEREMASGIGDFFSLPGRLIASAKDFEGKTWEDKFSNYLKSVGETEGQDVLDAILRHPATGAAAMIAPLVAPVMATAPATALIGEGAGVGFVSQMERKSKGDEYSGTEAMVDAFSGGIVPGGSKTLGVLKGGTNKLSRKIMDTVIKPSKKLVKQTKPYDVENIFKYGLDSKKGLKVIDQNIKNEMSNIGESYNKAIKDIPNETKISLEKAWFNASRKLAKEIKEGMHSEDYKGISRGLKYWKDYIDDFGANEVSVKKALGVRGSAGKLSKYDKMDPKAVKGTEKAARYFRDEINSQLDIFPEIRKLDKKRSDLMPIQEAVEDAVFRTKKNFIQSLNDNPALTTMMLGGLAGTVGGGYAGGIQGAVPGLALLGLSRGLKSPGLASGLSQFSDRAMTPLMNTLENPYIQRTVPGLARMAYTPLRGEQ